MTLLNLPEKKSVQTAGTADEEIYFKATEFNALRNALQIGTNAIRTQYSENKDGIFFIDATGTRTGGFRKNLATNKLEVSFDGNTWQELSVSGSSVTITGLAGEALTDRDYVRKDGDGKFYKATGKGIGFVTSDVALNDNAEVVIYGELDGFTGLEIGKQYYGGFAKATDTIQVNAYLHTMYEQLQVILSSLNDRFQFLKHVGDIDNGNGKFTDRFATAEGVKQTVNTTDTDSFYNSTESQYELAISSTITDDTLITSVSSTFQSTSLYGNKITVTTPMNLKRIVKSSSHNGTHCFIKDLNGITQYSSIFDGNNADFGNVELTTGVWYIVTGTNDTQKTHSEQSISLPQTKTNFTIDDSVYFDRDSDNDPSSGGPARYINITNIQYYASGILYESSSQLVMDTNTTELIGDENFAVYKSIGTIPTNTSKKVKLSDGTNETLQYDLDLNGNSTLIDISSLNSTSNLEVTEIPETTDNSITPTTKGCSLEVFK